MRMFYSIIVASFLLFVGSVLPSQAYAVVCQNKTAVVYSNGMFNNQDDARIAKNKLEIKLRSYPQALNLLADMEFYLAYADGNGGPSGTSFLAQLDEVFNQKVGDVHSLFWRWIGSVEASPQWFQDAMTSMAGVQAELTYIADQDFQKMLNGDGSTKDPGYRKLLVDGKRVLIVSHSQGNFYANAVYTTLITENAAWASSIGNVQVATPAAVNLGGQLGNNEPQITVNEDVVMNFVQTMSGVAMPSKPLGGGWSPNSKELGGVAARDAATYGHNFVTWYLAGTYTRNFIMKGIVDILNGVAGGYAGLQYPTQGCTPAVAPPPPLVQLPGTNYYRDDWGALTFNFSALEFRGYFYRGDPWGRFKNLRDEQKGLAYHVDMDFTLTNPGTRSWGFPMKTGINITDYVSLEAQKISFTFAGAFHPQDVLLWSGGLIFLSYDKNGFNSVGDYHRDDIVTVKWRKLTIVDNGAGVANRWVLQPVQSGSLRLPSYAIAREVNSGASKKWGAGTNNQWNKLGVAFRDGMTYTYSVPFSASQANWVNYPNTPFGQVNGVAVPAPYPQLKNYRGEYGVLDILDGVPTFTSLGDVPLQSDGVQQSGPPLSG